MIRERAHEAFLNQHSIGVLKVFLGNFAVVVKPDGQVLCARFLRCSDERKSIQAAGLFNS